MSFKIVYLLQIDPQLTIRKEWSLNWQFLKLKGPYSVLTFFFFFLNSWDINYLRRDICFKIENKILLKSPNPVES